MAVALFGAAAPVSLRVSPVEIRAENARWIDLGVQLPPGGIVLSQPYRPPYSSRSFIAPWAWYERFYATYRANHDYPISASQVRADLPVLRFLMEKTYAGYDTARTHGWDWDAWFKQWDVQLRARGNAQVPLAQAFAPWGALERFQLDNHSGVPVLREFTSGSTSAQLAAAPGGACTSILTATGQKLPLDVHDAGQQPHAVRSWDGTSLSAAWYVSYPRRNGTAVALQCGSHRVALHMVSADITISPKPSYEKIADGIAYVRMPTFTDANDDALTDLFAKTPDIGKERVVLLDLRGNDGGNAPLTLLNTWFAESAIERASELTQVGTQSCFRTALFLACSSSSRGT
jgi:hypothetical protein